MNNSSALPARLDWTAVLAVACVACGWFWMSSLTTDLVAVRLHFHFYDVLTLLRNPRSVLTGAGGDEGTLNAWLFGTVCVLAILAALAPLVSPRKVAWLGCAAPFALMALCGAILYHDFSGEMIADSGRFGDTGSQLIHLANELTDKISGRVAQQVSVGVGGYLALAASAFLAFKGLVGFLKAP